MSNKKFLSKHHKVIKHYVGVHPTISGRFAIYKEDDGSILDDCQGYGYKTKEAARKAGWFKYSSGYKEFDKAKNFWKKHPSLVKDIESIEWYGIKDHDTREEIDDAILDCCYKYCEENNITDFEESFLKRM